MCNGHPQLNRGTQRWFPPKTLKALFRLSRVLLDLKKYTLSGTIKFVSVLSSQGTFSLFEITRASVFFPKNFRCNAMYYESDNVSDSSLHHIFNPKIIGFLFFAKNSLVGGVKSEKLNFRKS